MKFHNTPFEIDVLKYIVTLSNYVFFIDFDNTFD